MHYDATSSVCFRRQLGTHPGIKPVTLAHTSPHNLQGHSYKQTTQGKNHGKPSIPKDTTNRSENKF